ncbi:MAG TPA: hypothetical protein VF056_08635 [Thermoleophilaceae bacterium]
MRLFFSKLLDPTGRVSVKHAGIGGAALSRQRRPYAPGDSPTSLRNAVLNEPRL